jgi:hypothetical protein
MIRIQSNLNRAARQTLGQASQSKRARPGTFHSRLRGQVSAACQRKSCCACTSLNCLCDCHKRMVK